MLLTIIIYSFSIFGMIMFINSINTVIIIYKVHQLLYSLPKRSYTIESIHTKLGFSKSNIIMACVNDTRLQQTFTNSYDEWKLKE